ncbi:MAG: hypothetical protein ACTSWN_02430, partial [Promethearchaeota archaeon]
MSFKYMPPPPPDSKETCECLTPVPVKGKYCGACGKWLQSYLFPSSTASAASGVPQTTLNQAPVPPPEAAPQTQAGPVSTPAQPVIQQPQTFTTKPV